VSSPLSSPAAVALVVLGAATAVADATTTAERLVAETLAWSRARQDFAIVVDACNSTLAVYKDGLAVAAWPVELGLDPSAPTRRQGDRRTPEGRYRVTWRRELGQTRFYKALLLDYPNADDRRNGLTGGDIEIHGRGSGRRPGDGGTNWTLGCVALSDLHIDQLFALEAAGRKVREGTSVTIVFCGRS
jgi:murein L,D-transpeptidase YafK